MRPRIALAGPLAAALVVMGSALQGGCFFSAERLPPHERHGEIPLVGRQGASPHRPSPAILERLRAEGGDVVEHHLTFMQSQDDSPLTTGNDARLLVDGDATYEAMFAAIASAKDHVNVETYILEGDRVGKSLAEALIKKRAQGIAVNLMYDSVGSINTSSDYFQRLENAGVTLCEFNPLNPVAGRSRNPNHRDHRKLLIVDGRLAFTGGLNFDADYDSSIGSALRKKMRRQKVEAAKNDADNAHWRETQIEIRGPAVAQFQHLFFDNWQQQICGPVAPASHYFPRLAASGDKVIRVLASSADERQALTIYYALLSAIERAQRSVFVTMAYFVPDRRMMEALMATARRGVDVRLLLPGFSDLGVVFHAGRSYYSELLDAGVKIYEKRDEMLHAKTAVVDGAWSTIGSANMDFRSFFHNSEINAEILDMNFGTEMMEMFRNDIATAAPVEKAQWEVRPRFERVEEWFGRLWQYWL